MLYKRKHRSEYKKISLDDAVLFHDIPLIKSVHVRNDDTYIYMKIILIGFYRKETISYSFPKYYHTKYWSMNGGLYLEYMRYIESIAVNACMEKWPLEEPFSYVFSHVNLNTYELDIRYPEEYGEIIPDWKSAREALRVILDKNVENKDALFISLYNEVLKINITNFRSKYKLTKNQNLSPTERILKITNVPEEVKRFIQRIDMPTIEREADNNNKKSFDFVRIRISIPTKESFINRKEFIEDNMKWIIAVTLNKLKDIKKFTRYGVPVEYLSLKRATITCTSELELLFELKDKLINLVEY